MCSPQLNDLPSPPCGKTGWPWTYAPEFTAAHRDFSRRDWPRLSVVTPSFNQASFIEETIRSVLLQGYPNLEYFVIDGGSSDESVRIIRKYEKWLAAWVSEPDRGQAHAINKGWARSKGELQSWINSDDVYLPGALCDVANRWADENDAALIFGNYLVVDEKGDVLREVKAECTDLEGLIRFNVIGQPAAFVASTALTKVGLLDESLHLCMDYDLWLRIASIGRLVHIPKRLAAFRWHASSKSSAFNAKMLKETVDVAERFVKGAANTPTQLWSEMETLLAAPYCDAGLALWFSGELRDGLSLLRKAVKARTPLDLESLGERIGRQAIASLDGNAEQSVELLVESVPELARTRRSALAWVSAVRSVSSDAFGLAIWKDMAKAIWFAPRLRLLRAIRPAFLRAVLGTRNFQSMRTLARRLLGWQSPEVRNINFWNALE